MATLIHESGDRVPYTPSGADVAAGQVVLQGELFGVAEHKILDGVPGWLRVTGEWTLPKAAGASTEITAGATVYWDHDDDVITTDADDGEEPPVAFVLVGKAIETAVDAATTIRVRLSQ